MTLPETSRDPTLSARCEQLLDAIAHEEARIGRLEAAEVEARSRLEMLRSELASLANQARTQVDSASPSVAMAPRTPAAKVRLFLSFFRGREDVFATRFVSTRTGKPGYAPACRNKFVRGVCELPKIKCGECPNQAFLPFDDTAVLAHLTGRHVMGVYPLLENQTCWFLAVDFDESTWIEDVKAFVETSRRVGPPRPWRGATSWA